MSCALSTGINNLRSAAGIVSNAQTVANHYVVPYTNPQSIQWDADTETFMDVRCPSDSDVPCATSADCERFGCCEQEWTMFDIADPRWGSWSLCWPHTLENQSGWEHGRMGSLPCPNMSMSNPYRKVLTLSRFACCASR